MIGVPFTLNRAVAFMMELEAQFDSDKKGYITKTDFVRHLFMTGNGTERSTVKDRIDKLKMLDFLKEDYATERLIFTFRDSKMYAEWQKQKGLGGFLND